MVRIGYWHFAFLGQESQWSAEASECAAEQDAFWEYHDYLFENLGRENRSEFNHENLKRFAGELGLDTEAFSECLDSGRHTQIVQQETAAGQQIGIRSTPSFLVNGQPVIGAQPFEVFEQVIEQNLNQ